MYNLDKKEYPNGVNGFNCAPKATPDVNIASVQDVLETELASPASSGMSRGQLLAVSNMYSNRSFIIAHLAV